MFKNLFRRYMEQAGDESATSGGANTNAPASAPETPAASGTPAGTAPAAADAGTLPPEQQAAADATKAADEAAKAAKEPEGAPEKYEFNLPEGQTLNADVQAQFEATARELNLPQSVAQKIIETMAPKIAATQADAFAKVQTEWTDAVKADKELGGDKFDANLAVAKKAMDRFGTPALKTFLNDSGLGNHPEMVRMMFKAGQAISEDKHVPASQGNAKARDAAKTLYPNSN